MAAVTVMVVDALMLMILLLYFCGFVHRSASILRLYFAYQIFCCIAGLGTIGLLIYLTLVTFKAMPCPYHIIDAANFTPEFAQNYYIVLFLVAVFWSVMKLWHAVLIFKTARSFARVSYAAAQWSVMSPRPASIHDVDFPPPPYADTWGPILAYRRPPQSK